MRDIGDSFAADRVERDDLVEGIAVVDNRVVPAISDIGRLATFVLVRATHSPRGPFLIRDGPEVGNDPLRGVGLEKLLVNRIAFMLFDVRNSGGGQGFGIQEAEKNGPLMASIWAVDYHALLEVGFVLGEVVDDGDGDGRGVIDVNASGIGHGLNDIIEPGDLEARGEVEDEGSWAGGRKIVHGGCCEGIRFNRGHTRSF